MDSRLTLHPLGYYEIAEKPSPEELQKYYADKYYQEPKGGYEQHEYSQDELTYFQSKLKQRWHAIHSIMSGKRVLEGRFLDVGCGEGYALAFFHGQGWSVKGIDFSSAGIKSKNPGHAKFLVTGDLFSLLAEEISSGNSYDVVWLQNVLEHVIDPVDLLNSLRKLVSPEGVAVITVPNDCSPIQCAALRLRYIDHAFWIASPDHLSYFDHNSLRNIAKATGWHCVDIHGDFPIDWYLHHPGSNYVCDKKAGKAAHRARINIDNIINEQPIEYVIEFWRALARLGMGRNITAFFCPAEKC